MMANFTLDTRIELRADAYEMERGFKAESLNAMEVIARIWHKRYLPLHFTERAYSRYGVRPRTEEYVARKRSDKRHNIPNVWSGETRRSVKHAIFTSVRSRTDGGVYRARVKMSVPDYIKRRKGGSGVSELTRVSSEEVRTLGRIARGRIAERMERRRMRAAKLIRKT